MPTVEKILIERESAAAQGAGCKLKVAAYCRVSTETEEQKTSFDQQVETYTEMIEANPEWELAGIYADEGISGTSAEKRPEFMRMIRDCEEGKINLVITKSISRFARNLLDCITYMRKLNSMGVHIIFENNRIDTRERHSEMLLTVLAGFAQEESWSISENTIWGIRKRFEDGTARWCKLYGYEKNKNGEYQIVPEQAEVVREVFRLYELGGTISEIRSALKEKGIPSPTGAESWSQASVCNMIRNERYAGDLLVQKFVTEDHLSHKAVRNDCTEIPSFYIKNHHKAIVPREQFERVQQIRSMRRTQHSRADESMGACNQYPLGQKLKCPHCGSVLYQRAVKTQVDHSSGWCCEGSEKACGGFIIRSRLVEPALLRAYEELDVADVEAKAKNPEYGKDANILLAMKEEMPAFDRVDYWWVDDLIDHIEFGAHSKVSREAMRRKAQGKTDDDRTMTVFWRCGITTTVSSGVIKDKDNPGVVAEMERRRQIRMGEAK